MRNLAVLGSTGSIGTQTLDVIREIGCAKIVSLTAGSNVALILKQAEEFKPFAVSVSKEEDAQTLIRAFKEKGLEIEVGVGERGNIYAATLPQADMVLNAVVGAAGIRATYEAIRAKKDIALANKETLVAAGEIITQAAKEENISLLPVDSEHSAIFQCLQGAKESYSKIYLTASGGPFRGKTKDELENVTAADALKHPNWSMGRKITIDSATLMNKGLEFIEAKWLFDAKPEQIEILVHPQSVIHSMVGMRDGAVIAQLAPPDMRLPIAYALSYPFRYPNPFPAIDFLTMPPLTFFKPDYENFPCLSIALSALNEGGLVPAVMNAANEIAVGLFLDGKIGFNGIARLIERTINAYIKTNHRETGLDGVLAADGFAREFALSEV
ncbi:1-deoxy-D-xylulose 5-phosphate reductoisomerase [Clostridia bacterium]|nr:1-deoxy-D-xylulose 5-phosphate reductoisomerase [Clostridia bacterium]